MTTHIQPSNNEIAFPMPRLNAAIVEMAARTIPHGFHTSPDAPNTWEALRADYALYGVVTVWDGASDRTIYDDAAVNMAFRAWHDFRHISAGADFTPCGEARTAGAQIGDIWAAYGLTDETLLWARVIWAEIVGQGAYLQRYGDFPKDQAGFVKAYLASPVDALGASW